MKWLVLALAVGSGDEFEWFRCDACRATFFMLNKTASTHQRLNFLRIWEFLEVVEGVCNGFNKNDYGVKQFEGLKYLFGPGIVDHLKPDQGFGQMGMGDYDVRLQVYCRMFVEEADEDRLLLLLREGQLDKEELCREECLSNASGTTGPKTDKKPKKVKEPKISVSNADTATSARQLDAKVGRASCKPASELTLKVERMLDGLSAEELQQVIITATERLYAKVQ